MYKALSLLLLPLIFLSAGCGSDNLGDRLFEVQYPVIEFPIPAGQSRIQQFVVADPSVATRFQEEMQRAGVTADDIDLVGGLRARVTSLTGDDFSEFERMELRVCPVGQSGGCDQFDLLFSVDDLFRRRQVRVDLNPGLRNLKDIFLGERMRVELILVAGDFSSVALDARLEWSVQAVGNLE
ncbi:hypothetical protein [Lewinella sp. 4G2]|uniref:hypothetical protein n=1 Tax=Lewinella sp. 4G2 TaxID=1803372 RepID=UPI0007B4E370|nr:hypothetical protein [Lewinella sp. 4G2]OAV42987.1 hypothetical protein A3850_000045 [Lewinella sp. 4G2]